MRIEMSKRHEVAAPHQSRCSSNHRRGLLLSHLHVFLERQVMAESLHPAGQVHSWCSSSDLAITVTKKGKKKIYSHARKHVLDLRMKNKSKDLGAMM